MTEPATEDRTLFPLIERQGRSKQRYKAGYINRTGQTVVPAIYERVTIFREGFGAIQTKDRKWGVVSHQGDIVIPPFSSQAPIFREGLAEFSIGSKSGVIDVSGNIIAQPQWKHILGFHDHGLACVQNFEDLCGYINAYGEVVIPPFFEDARGFSEGLAAVKLGGKWGYIHPDGSTAIPIEFVCDRGMAGPFREGLARVARNGRWGYIDKTGMFVIKPRFDMALEFSEGLARVELEKRYGFVNRSGDVVIDIALTHAGSFTDGLCVADIRKWQPNQSIKDASKTGFINCEGAFVIPPQFFSAHDFHQGLAFVETEKELMYIAQNGDPVWRGPWVDVYINQQLYPPTSTNTVYTPAYR